MTDATITHLPHANGHPAANREPELAKALEEYRSLLEAGQPPERSAFLARHPAIADSLAECLAGLEFVHAVAPELSRDAVGTPLDQAGESLCGTLGDFRILREVGRGGMGVVYEATQLSLNRRIALKVLPFASTLDSRQLQRFKNEAQAAACLHHTNIVPVFATGVERGVHYYAMQFIEGHTLAEVIENLTPQPPSRSGKGEKDRSGTGENEQGERPGSPPRFGEGPGEGLSTTALAALSTLRSTKPAAFYRTIAELGIQAAEALEYAHQMGIVHRDIKPGNLMLEADGATGRQGDGESRAAGLIAPAPRPPLPPSAPRLWIMDFGLAQVQTDTRLTMSGDLLGTLRYMSPEQALAKRVIVDHRTDIYSLGATLYELLTQQPAVPGEDKQEVLRRIAFEDPKPPRKISKAIPAELETIVLKAMEKEAEGRYATAGELAADLRRWLMHEPIRAKRPSALGRIRKWSHRHQGLVRAAAAMLAFAVVGLTLSTWFIWQEKEQTRQEKERAETNERRTLESEADTKAFSDFLAKHVFATARPKDVENGLGIDVTVAQALEAAEGKIDEMFGGRPKAEATTRHHLGVTWRNLTRYAKAEEHLRRAVELRERELGADAELTLASRFQLALTLKDAGRAREAIPILEQMLQVQRAQLGPDHAHALKTANLLALAFLQANRPADVLPLLEQALAHSPDDLSLLNSLGTLYIQLHRPRNAIPILQRVFEHLRAERGGQDPRTLVAMNNLAAAYMEAGLFNDALPLVEEEVNSTRARFGPNHRETLISMNNLGALLKALGRVKDALTLQEETLGLMKLHLGPGHPNTQTCMQNLGQAYHEVRNFDRAETLAREWLALRRERQEELSGPLAQLSMTLLQQQQYAEAEGLLRECLAIREKRDPQHWLYFNTLSLLGGSLLGQKDYAEAEPLLLRGYEGMANRESTPKIRLTEALERLVQLYDARGEKEKAAEWHKKLEEARTTIKAQK